MKINNIHAQPFAPGPVFIRGGDVLTVSHRAEDGSETVLTRFEIASPAVLTHSILFELDGQLNHVVGTQATLDWLSALAM